jgi:hypothetical protein
MQPTLKSPISERLKLECADLLLNFAFNFNSHRYSWGGQLPPHMWEIWSKPYIEAGAYTRPLFGST